MAAGEPGDRGPLIVPPTVCKNKERKGRGRGRERALTPLPWGMEMIVVEKTRTSVFVVGTY